MLIVKITPESNGSHASQMSSAPIKPPDGWAVIPPALEATALPLLPWVKLTLEGGVVASVEDDVEAREAWEGRPVPEPPLDETTQLRLAIAELAEVQVSLDLENKLAIAELAEAMLGGGA